MGEFMVGTWLYTLLTLLPVGLWSIWSLASEGWLGSRGKVEKGMLVVFVIGIVYQTLLPFYWCFFLAPKGIPYV